MCVYSKVFLSMWYIFMFLMVRFSMLDNILCNDYLNQLFVLSSCSTDQIDCDHPFRWPWTIWYGFVHTASSRVLGHLYTKKSVWVNILTMFSICPNLIKCHLTPQLSKVHSSHWGVSKCDLCLPCVMKTSNGTTSLDWSEWLSTVPD